MEKKKKGFGVGIVLLVSIVLALSVLAARLPTVGGDSGGWGTTLNDFLNIAHESGGNIKSGYITGSMIADTTIERGDLANDLINGTKIVDGGVGNSEINESAINGTQIIDATIGAIDIAANTINTTHIAIAGLGGNALASNLINTSHIAIAGLGGNALANNIINTTHIAAGGLTGNAIASYAINNSHIAVSSINESQISNTAALNVTSLAVTGVNRTATGVPYPYFNISGIFFNRTIYDLPSIAIGDCGTVNINMTGIPANSLCIFVGGDDIFPPNVQALATVNLTFTGLNSTAGNCRVRVCNVDSLTAANPGILTFAAIGIAGNGL